METNTSTVNESVSLSAKLAGKYLTFKLAEEEYGIEILSVQEIIRMQKVTKVPRVPDFVRGVINLRGRVIPVIELSRKFGMEYKEDTEKTCIVVVQVQNGDQQIIMGITIDDVHEVRDLLPEEIDEAPSFGTAIDIAFIMGVAKISEKVIMLLDIRKVLTENELDAIAKMKNSTMKAGE